MLNNSFVWNKSNIRNRIGELRFENEILSPHCWIHMKDQRKQNLKTTSKQCVFEWMCKKKGWFPLWCSFICSIFIFPSKQNQKKLIWFDFISNSHLKKLDLVYFYIPFYTLTVLCLFLSICACSWLFWNQHFLQCHKQELINFLEEFLAFNFQIKNSGFGTALKIFLSLDWNTIAFFSLLFFSQLLLMNENGSASWSTGKIKSVIECFSVNPFSCSPHTHILHYVQVRNQGTSRTKFSWAEISCVLRSFIDENQCMIPFSAFYHENSIFPKAFSLYCIICIGWLGIQCVNKWYFNLWDIALLFPKNSSTDECISVSFDLKAFTTAVYIF